MFRKVHIRALPIVRISLSAAVEMADSQVAVDPSPYPGGLLGGGGGGDDCVSESLSNMTLKIRCLPTGRRLV